MQYEEGNEHAMNDFHFVHYVLKLQYQSLGQHNLPVSIVLIDKWLCGIVIVTDRIALLFDVCCQ